MLARLVSRLDGGPRLSCVHQSMQPAGSFGARPQFSGDGNWWWDGTRWTTTLSPDGGYRWTGTGWAPVRKMFLGDSANQSIASAILGLLCGPMFFFGLWSGHRAYQELPHKRTQAIVGMIVNGVGIGLWVLALFARAVIPAANP